MRFFRWLLMYYTPKAGKDDDGKNFYPLSRKTWTSGRNYPMFMFIRKASHPITSLGKTKRSSKRTIPKPNDPIKREYIYRPA